MTQDQVKSELNELRELGVYNRDFSLNTRWCELRNKYDIAIKQLDIFDQLIFRERIILRRTFVQAGMNLHYSQECIRKRWEKITKQLAEMLTIPKTNFDRITESVESLAEFLVENDRKQNYYDEDYYKNYINGQSCYDREQAKKSIIQWLQKECE